MRSLLLACTIACIAPTAQAGVFTFDINDNFAVRQTAVGNVNQPSPLGGLLSGFITLDTDATDNDVIVDYELTSFLPNFLSQPAPAVDYIFGDPGESASFVSATGALTLVSNVQGIFSNNLVNQSQSVLFLTLGALGEEDLSITGSESFRNCRAFFTVFGLSNPCDGIIGNNSGLDTLASRQDDGGNTGGGNTGGGNTGGGNTGGGTVTVPAPASLPLMLTGLTAGLLLRRRR